MQGWAGSSCTLVGKGVLCAHKQSLGHAVAESKHEVEPIDWRDRFTIF